MIPLPQLPPADLSWHRFAVCLPDERGDRWAADWVTGDRWDQQWVKDHLCSVCPVVEDCLEDALVLWDASGHNPPGVWGGTAAEERKGLMAARRAERAAAAGEGLGAAS